MSYSLKTSCGCGKTDCDCDGNGCCTEYRTPIPSLEPENTYHVNLTEVFETSGADGCTTSTRSTQTIIELEDFKRDAIAAIDPGDATVPGGLNDLVDKMNELLQNMRDSGLLK